MEPSIVIRDHRCLEELQVAQRFASDSIMKVVAHVSDHFDSMIEVMKQQKQVLEEKVEEARERLSEAEDDYSSCLSSQTYDEEDNCYYPSCDMEAECVDRCREEYEKLYERDKKASQVLNECEYELSKYRELGDVIIPPGGETLMKYLSKDHTDKANEKMDKIRACVEDYLSVSCNIHDAKMQRNVEQTQLYEEGVNILEEKAEEKEVQASQDKAKAFHEATTSLQKKMSHMGYREADAIAICPRCKRPVNVCICQHILERSR